VAACGSNYNLAGIMIKKLAAGLVIVLALLALVAYRAVQRRRDLNETLTWIEQTYNPHEGADIFSQGHGFERHYAPRKNGTEEISEEFHTTFFPKGGCNALIHSETSPIGVWEDTPSKADYTFNLRDIDPDSIKLKTFDLHKDVFDCADPEEVTLCKLDCSGAEVYFLTRDGATSINEEYVRTYSKLTGAEHELRSTSKTQKMWLIVNDVAYAQRLAKAWKHAVELCGGRPSKF